MQHSPIDQTAPIERIAYILEDSSSSYIITSRDFEITTKAKIITLKDVHAGKSPRDEDAESELKFNNERTAYILYTSGSTEAKRDKNLATSTCLSTEVRQLPD